MSCIKQMCEQLIVSENYKKPGYPDFYRQKKEDTQTRKMCVLGCVPQCWS
ncbi:hypothetical protein GCM10007199_39800 [Fictibacillus barbaricus]|nr:hypothetical protein GCM10007199_39800 [Fictibacillus barbaricus]